LHAPQVGKHLFLRFFANRTGVEQDDIGIFRALRQFHPAPDTQHIGHLGRVVLVHLAAKGADKEFAGFFRIPRHDGLRLLHD